MTHHRIHKTTVKLLRSLDDFTEAYLEAAFFTDITPDIADGNEALQDQLDSCTVYDLHCRTFQEQIAECVKFQHGCAVPLALAYAGGNGESPVIYNEAMAGHDFWLSRNRHGAGFWDRYLGAAGAMLHAAALHAGEVSLELGDDGFLYFQKQS
jgi:hypothetical protein